MQPLSRPDRYVPLDALRGLALFGVLLVNLLTLFRVSLFAHITGSDVDPADGAGRIVMVLADDLLEFKAFTLFSFIFGAGIAVQAERIQANKVLFLLRRFLVLLAFGLVHITLIWNGDILTLYAICGILLLPFVNLPFRLLAIAGAILAFGSYFVSLPVSLPNAAHMRVQAAEATRVYGHGGFAEILAFRWSETRDYLLPLLLLTLPRTLGVVLMGMAAWKSGMIRNPNRRVLIPLLAGLLMIAITGVILHWDLAAHVPLAFAYAAAVLLWLPHSTLLAAAGQMAFTNYLTQSIVFSLVFYGFGLGLFGRVRPAPAAAGGIVLYILQLYFSRWWLQHFRFGPAEWLWRSLTYGRRQPMLLDPTISRNEMKVFVTFVFLLAIPAIHGGMPLLLSRLGPRIGTTGFNLLGVPVAVCAFLLLWLYATGFRAVDTMPERFPLGLTPPGIMQTGPYAWSRHPLYIAEMLLWLSVAVYCGSPVVLAILLLGVAVAVFVVLPKEEGALHRHFGGEYQRYCERVPAFTDFRPHYPNPEVLQASGSRSRNPDSPG